jgi:hypothetical protein
MRISVTFDEQTAAAVRYLAGGDGKMSGWIAGVVKQQLLADACQAAGAYDAEKDDPVYEVARLEGRV